MDFLNDCPLNTDEAFLTEMVENCTKPAVLLSKSKRIVAKSVLAGDKNALFDFGLPMGKNKIRSFYRYLDSLKEGDVIRLEKKGSIKGFLICYPQVYLFYFDDTLSEKPKNEPEFVYSSSFTLLTRRKKQKFAPPLRTRREQKAPQKTDETAELKQDSIYKKLSGESKSSVAKTTCFSPDAVIEGVCNATKGLLLEKGFEFEVVIEKSPLYCYESYEKYSDAFMTMMLIAVSRTENDRVCVKGASNGCRYTAEVCFKYTVDRLGKSSDVLAWESVFGEFFDKIYAVSRRLFWELRVVKHSGGILSLTLSVPVSEEKDSSLLHPESPPISYYEGLVKKYYTLLW